MIVREIEQKSLSTARRVAGDKHEKNIAFFLRREFKNDKDVMVFNDFKFKFKDETAQIDHLIVYKLGFIIIESKSINGNMKVNEQGEWSRSYQDKWQGMPSPIKQILLQEELLKAYLHENRSDILSTFLGLQQSFGGRCWDRFCAISSHAIIERENIPKDISKKIVKAEFLVENILKVMKSNNTLGSAKFKESDFESLKNFLAPQLPTNNSTENLSDIPFQKSQEDVDIRLDVNTNNTELVICRTCNQKTELEPFSGKYGYYVKCRECKSNTSLKRNCSKCSSNNTNVHKKNDIFTLRCSDCETEKQIFGKNK